MTEENRRVWYGVYENDRLFVTRLGRESAELVAYDLDRENREPTRLKVVEVDEDGERRVVLALNGGM